VVKKRDDRERYRYGADPQVTDEPLPHLAELFLEAAVVDQYALRPGEHAFAFGGQAKKPLPALDDQHAEAFLQLLDARRKRWLGHVAHYRRAQSAARGPTPLDIEDAE
jgi:hypothetical protein